MRPAFPFPQVTTGNLNIAIVGQLPPTKFALSDEFEPGAMKMVGFEAAFRRGFLWKQDLEHAPRHANDALILAHCHAELYGRPIGVPAPVRGKTKEHCDLLGGGYHVRVMFSNSACQGKGVVERFVATGGRLPVLREAEVCEGPGHNSAEPTRPERNAQPANLRLPSKDDPQQMHYHHDEKQCAATRGRIAEFEKKTKRHSRKLDRARVLTSMYVAR
jgi:hypothetical protein